jgi:hypothetical protein
MNIYIRKRYIWILLVIENQIKLMPSFVYTLIFVNNRLQVEGAIARFCFDLYKNICLLFRCLVLIVNTYKLRYLTGNNEA